MALNDENRRDRDLSDTIPDTTQTDPWADIFASLQPIGGTVEAQNPNAGQPGNAATGLEKSISDAAVGTLAGAIAPGFGLANLAARALTDPNFTVDSAINSASFGLLGSPDTSFPGTITDPNVIANEAINPAATGLANAAVATSGQMTTDEATAAKTAATDPAAAVGTAGGAGGGGLGGDPGAGIGGGPGGGGAANTGGAVGGEAGFGGGYAKGGKVEAGSGPGQPVKITAHQDEVVLNRPITRVIDPLDRYLTRLNALGNRPRRSREATRKDAKMLLSKMMADL